MAAGYDDDWDDPDLLLALDQAEMEAFANKEAKKYPSFSERTDWSCNKKSNGEFQDTVESSGSVSGSVLPTSAKKRLWEEESEGEYLAALRGSNSQSWQKANSKGQRTGGLSGTAAESFQKRQQIGSSVPASQIASNSSFAKWNGGGRFASATGEYGETPDKQCPCGGGICRILTASTEKNNGRQFYRCPLSQSEGQCPFFEWCDAAAGPGGEEPQLACECGAGMCTVMTAKTEKNNGRKFFRCPSREASCGFFKWCDEVGRSPVKASGNLAGGKTSFNNGFSNNEYRTPNNTYGGSPYSGVANGTNGDSTSICFTCNESGHWSSDCPNRRSYGGTNNTAGMYGDKDGGTTGSGSCFKCGEEGHWSKDCPSKVSGGYGSGPKGSSFQGAYSAKGDGGGGGGGEGGSGTCFKCGLDGHWAKDCASKGSGGYGYGSGPQTGGSFQGAYGNRKGGTSDGRNTNNGSWRNNYSSEETKGRNVCYKCKEPGHWAPSCPN